MKTCLFVFLCILLFCAGCASTDLPTVKSKTLRLEDDEQRLWQRSKEEQKRLDRSGLILDDPILEAYLNSVAQSLQPPDVFEIIPFNVKIIKNRYLNAFAYPNGQIYVHTGILSRMDNEVHLATLLAHEMAHCTQRHAVKGFRNAKNKTAFLAILQTATMGLGGVGELAGLLGALGTVASVTGYSRENETEADSEGFKAVGKAGYDITESKKLFECLRQEVKDEKKKEPFFFGSHPRLQERIDNYERLMTTAEKMGGVRNRERFLDKIKNVVLLNAFLDLKAGRFETAQRSAEKYAVLQPADPKAFYLLGEIARQKGEEKDTEKALKLYEKAVSLDPDYPDAYRGAGLVYLKRGDRTKARKLLESYLARASNASDRGHVEEYIKECSAGGK
jgi:predicted Zn-dependent protease